VGWLAGVSVAISPTLRDRWASRRHVGNARPTMQVQVRRGYLERHRIGHQWTETWTPTAAYKTLPGLRTVTLEQSFDTNGITTATIDMANLAYVDVMGAVGLYHKPDPGHFSPYRAYHPPDYPGLGVPKNEWDRILGAAAQVTIRQGYGDEMVTTFTGLIDSINGTSQAPGLTIVARDFGQLLTDCRCFGWNIDPNMHDPITFHGEKAVHKLATSHDGNDRAMARKMRNKWVIVEDLSEAVTTILAWSGLPTSGVKKTGASLNEPTQFGATEYLIDVIRKAQDVCGYTFFMAEPSNAYPLGRPIFRRSQVTTVPQPVCELRDTDLLTGLNWQRSDEPLAGIIRVRGRPTTELRGGRALGGVSGGVGAARDRIMGVYRPPWHVYERDARLLRHLVHIEPQYKTEQQCLVAGAMIALAEALAAITATIEIPTHPGLQLDDIIAIRDHPSGLATRAWIASKQATFTAGKETTWKQTLGVALLDTPDVVEVVEDLHAFLNGAGEAGPGHRPGRVYA
jgi:hypothetical protein